MVKKDTEFEMGIRFAKLEQKIKNIKPQKGKGPKKIRFHTKKIRKVRTDFISTSLKPQKERLARVKFERKQIQDIRDERARGISDRGMQNLSVAERKGLTKEIRKTRVASTRLDKEIERREIDLQGRKEGRKKEVKTIVGAIGDTAREAKRFTAEAAARISSMAASKLKERAISRRVLKRNRATVVVREHKPAPYIPIFFKNGGTEIKKDTRQFYFK